MIKVFQFKYFVKRVNLINLVIGLLKKKNKTAWKKDATKIDMVYIIEGSSMREEETLKKL